MNDIWYRLFEVQHQAVNIFFYIIIGILLLFALGLVNKYRRKYVTVHTSKKKNESDQLEDADLTIAYEQLQLVTESVNQLVEELNVRLKKKEKDFHEKNEAVIRLEGMIQEYEETVNNMPALPKKPTEPAILIIAGLLTGAALVFGYFYWLA